MKIRKIEKADNRAVAEIVRSVLLELGAPKVGTAYEDPSVDCMYETYQQPNAVFYIVEGDEKKVIGCAGINRLQNGEETICELQKMYFLPQARGLGIGAKMIDLCLENAKALGFTKCYLETMPFMKDAQKLYTKKGFYSLSGPLGNTGHSYCSIWMMKDL